MQSAIALLLHQRRVFGRQHINALNTAIYVTHAYILFVALELRTELVRSHGQAQLGFSWVSRS